MSAERNQIVVLDSYASFAETVVDLLNREGFQAVTMPRNELDSYIGTHQVDLITTDLRGRDDRDEKDISGLVLARRMSEQGVPVIILSGAPVLPEGNPLPENARFLGKRSGLKELVKTVKEVLGQE